MASTAETPKTPLCFVIGPIGKDGEVERKHADMLLHAVIRHVLEAEEFGYKVKRADEDADPGMIGDRVISDILHAEIVVADLTDLNPNALYELGIRHSALKPTIHIAKRGTNLPFDNLGHSTIFIDATDWQSIEQGRTRLAASARAITKADFQVSNPITQANASFKMRQSADPRDRIVAQLEERVTTLEVRSRAPFMRPAVKPRGSDISKLLQEYLARGTTPDDIPKSLDGILKAFDPNLEIRYSSALLPDRLLFRLFEYDKEINRYEFPP
jgi:hypothetical protein